MKEVVKMLTWYDAIRELCLQVDGENTIKDILSTATDEHMITAHDAARIADMVKVPVSCPPGVYCKGCTGVTGPWCGYCQAENG